MLGEGCSAASPHGLASNVFLKEEAKTVHKERPGRDCACFCEPEGRGDCYEFLSFFVLLNISPHYAVLSSVGLIHTSSIVSSYVLLFVLYVVSLLFYIPFRLFICLSI